jgi:hypothetical protein
MQVDRHNFSERTLNIYLIRNYIQGNPKIESVYLVLSNFIVTV